MTRAISALAGRSPHLQILFWTPMSKRYNHVSTGDAKLFDQQAGN
jgi:hypothetical protein